MAQRRQKTNNSQAIPNTQVSTRTSKRTPFKQVLVCQPPLYIRSGFQETLVFLLPDIYIVLALSDSDEGHLRDASCALNLISTFLLYNPQVYLNINDEEKKRLTIKYSDKRGMQSK